MRDDRTDEVRELRFILARGVALRALWCRRRQTEDPKMQRSMERERYTETRRSHGRVAFAWVLLVDALPLLLLCTIHLSRSTISATTLPNMMWRLDLILTHVSIHLHILAIPTCVTISTQCHRGCTSVLTLYHVRVACSKHYVFQH
jgi:hypothetical protein